ncbi:MAG: ribosome-binding factor [Actinomycetota bacterium]|jgi:ribosome-binding factor A
MATHRYPRTARLSESLREVIADELIRIDDERLSLVAITSIDVDPEMNRAIVFYDSLAGEEGDEEIGEALAEHRVRIQASVGRQVRAKKTPILSFRPDVSLRAAERIEEILHREGTLPVRPDAQD